MTLPIVHALLLTRAARPLGVAPSPARPEADQPCDAEHQRVPTPAVSHALPQSGRYPTLTAQLPRLPRTQMEAQ
jgi:hypothetical protein